MRRGNFRQRKDGAAAHSLHMPDAALMAVHLAAEDAPGRPWDPPYGAGTARRSSAVRGERW